jgi:hypothetical protein
MLPRTQDCGTEEVNPATVSVRPPAPDAVATSPRCRIRVWFGNEVICTHVADPNEAEQYATLMARRFAGLVVTVDNEPGPQDPVLPHHLLWEQTVL